MIRKSILATLVLGTTFFSVDLQDAEAARRRGFFRRARVNRTVTYRNRTTRPSQKLHMTHSRSAILDGFSGHYGHDRSWYVGR